MPDGEGNCVYLVLTAREQKRKIGRLSWCYFNVVEPEFDAVLHHPPACTRPLLFRHVGGRVPVPHALGNVLGAGLAHTFRLRVRLWSNLRSWRAFHLRNCSHVKLLEVPSVTVARYSARHSFRASGWACSGPITIIDPIATAPPVLRMVAVFIISIPSSRSARATLWNTQTLTDGSKAANRGDPPQTWGNHPIAAADRSDQRRVHTGRPSCAIQCVCGYPCRSRSGGPLPPRKLVGLRRSLVRNSA